MVVQIPPALEGDQWILYVLYVKRTALGFSALQKQIKIQVSQINSYKQQNESYIPPKIISSPKAIYNALERLMDQHFVTKILIPPQHGKQGGRAYPGYQLTIDGKSRVMTLIEEPIIARIGNYNAVVETEVQKYFPTMEKFLQTLPNFNQREILQKQISILLSQLNRIQVHNILFPTIPKEADRNEIIIACLFFLAYHCYTHISYCIQNNIQWNQKYMAPNSFCKVWHLKISKFQYLFAELEEILTLLELKVENPQNLSEFPRQNLLNQKHAYEKKVNDDQLINVYFHPLTKERMMIENIVIHSLYEAFINLSMDQIHLDLYQVLKKIFHEIQILSIIHPFVIGEFQNQHYQVIEDIFGFSEHFSFVERIHQKQRFFDFLTIIVKLKVKTFLQSTQTGFMTFPDYFLSELELISHQELIESENFQDVFITECKRYLANHEYQKALPILENIYEKLRNPEIFPKWTPIFSEILLYLINCYKASGNYTQISTLFKQELLRYLECSQKYTVDASFLLQSLDNLLEFDDSAKKPLEFFDFLKDWAIIRLNYFKSVEDLIIDQNSSQTQLEQQDKLETRIKWLRIFDDDNFLIIYHSIRISRTLKEEYLEIYSRYYWYLTLHNEFSKIIEKKQFLLHSGSWGKWVLINVFLKENQLEEAFKLLLQSEITFFTGQIIHPMRWLALQQEINYTILKLPIEKRKNLLRPFITELIQEQMFNHRFDSILNVIQLYGKVDLPENSENKVQDISRNEKESQIKFQNYILRIYSDYNAGSVLICMYTYASSIDSTGELKRFVYQIIQEFYQRYSTYPLSYQVRQNMEGILNEK